MPPSQAFDPVREAMEQAAVRYAVGGSWASSTFGEPRYTHGVDILADFGPRSLPAFLSLLPEAFYVDREEAMRATREARSFNVIHNVTLLKFDFYPVESFPLGMEELDRAVKLANSGLSQSPVPFVTPEDILLAKLYWFRMGRDLSEVQWRDIEGIVNACGASLDLLYLEQGASRLAVSDLLLKAIFVEGRDRPLGKPDPAF